MLSSSDEEFRKYSGQGQGFAMLTFIMIFGSDNSIDTSFWMRSEYFSSEAEDAPLFNIPDFGYFFSSRMNIESIIDRIFQGTLFLRTCNLIAGGCSHNFQFQSAS